MHLDEEVKPVAQKPLVLDWGHAVEQLEEEFLLLGGRWKHALRLDVIGLFRQAERAIGVSRLGLASEKEGSVLVWGFAYWEEEGSKEGPGIYRLGLAAQVGLAPHEVSGATEALLYETVAGAGQVSMVAQDRRHTA